MRRQKYLKETLGNAGIAGLNLGDLLTGNVPLVEMGDIKMIRLFVILMLVTGCDDNAYAAIPEPSTYAMLLVGLGLIGFTMRRAK